MDLLDCASVRGAYPLTFPNFKPEVCRKVFRMQASLFRALHLNHHSIATREIHPRRNMTEKRSVLVAKPGLDGHDRGAKVVARALRDAGMEVIYTGLRQTPEMIAEAALQEDVDVVGLSILGDTWPRPMYSGTAQSEWTGGCEVFIGGIVPDEDMPRLREMGITGIYGPGASTEDIIKDVRQAVQQ
jgi:methylmalonyl-CoA mutase C-terminal domain/subunit